MSVLQQRGGEREKKGIPKERLALATDSSDKWYQKEMNFLGKSSSDGARARICPAMGKRRNEAALSRRSRQPWGELVWGDGAAGRSTREALAAKLQHTGTGKLQGMGRGEQGCVPKFAEQTRAI